MIQKHDFAYLSLVEDVLKNGIYKEDRTGTGTYGVFSRMMRFNLADGTIPLLTTKKMHTRSIIHEILWYLSGSTNIKYLKDNKVTIWDEWADLHSELGPVYGYQWRQWPTYEHILEPEYDMWGNESLVDVIRRGRPIDQIGQLITQLKRNPHSRRLIVSAWNVADLDKMALPPCHYCFQFWTRPLSRIERVMIHGEGKFDASENNIDNWDVPKYALSCQLNQRSCDVGLGVPFNIVQYSILTRMVAQVVNMVVDEFVWVGTDIHIYTNHVEALREQIKREPFESPLLSFARDVDDIDKFKFEDFVIENYQSHPTIKMEVSV